MALGANPVEGYVNPKPSKRVQGKDKQAVEVAKKGEEPNVFRGLGVYGFRGLGFRV